MWRDYKGWAGAKQGPELPIGCALSRCEMEIDPLVIRVLLFSSSAMCVNAWGEKNVNNVSMEIAAAGSDPIPRVSTCDEERERVEENPVMRGKYREYKQ